MNMTTERVRRHYEAVVGDSDDRDSELLRFLDDLDEGAVTAAQLGNFDQFHVGGLAATVAFGQILGIAPDTDVLDAGSGLGGPSRYLAQTYGCRVSGVDLAPTYVAISRLLADRAGLSRVLQYEVADLLVLPFPDARFDAAYTQHVVMNIADRDAAYREIRRVLKPGGVFAFYDVLAADGKPEPLYPTPWAETAETSVLLDEAETRAALGRSGLTPTLWNDVTGDAVPWFCDQVAPSSAPTLTAVMGPRFSQMAANLTRNLAEGRLRLVMARCEAA
ncbi:MAG TPA: class I SAM-dependent methyltransferase [Caulobacteraceae bacterium]|nr:class I SAM-dependent methyltransferase [Caulobacteraceae bacterium]